MELRAGYKETEVGVIPEDWEVIELGKLMRFKNGINAPKEAYGTGYPFINVLDIINNTLIKAQNILGKVDVSAREFEASKVEDGDCVFQRSSETSEEVGQAAVYCDRSQPVTFGGFVILGKKIGRYDSIYLTYQLKSSISRHEIIRQSGGSTRYNISQLSLRQAKTVLPKDLPEQRAIATALGDVDALLGALDRLIAKKQALKAAAMQVLLTGEQRLPGFSGAWEVKKLGEVGFFIKGKGIRKNDSMSGTIPCVRYGELYTDHKDVVQNHRSFISRSVANTSVRMRNNDILFAGSGETKLEIGKSVAFIQDYEAYAGGDIVILRDHGQNGTFLGYLLNLPIIQFQKASYAQGDAVVHISANALAKIQIKLPPLPEQAAIARVLSDMDEELGVLAARRAKVSRVKAGMMGELLTGRVRLVGEQKTVAI